MGAESIVPRVTFTILAACGGFLLAVLWMDLMFDVQALRHRGVLPEPVLDSIGRYYRRVTTEAAPLGHLVGAVMLAAVATAVAHLGRGAEPRWAGWASLALCLPPIVLAQTRIFPAAARLGRGEGSAEERSRLARSICRAHLACLAAIGAFTALQLALAGRAQ
jgi:hypothetical protein